MVQQRPSPSGVSFSFWTKRAAIVFAAKPG
jgi:hypothetical protein